MEALFKKLENNPIITKYFDYYLAVLLGVTTVLTAVAAFQGSLWGGNSLSLYSKANAQINSANTEYLDYVNTYTATELQDLKDDVLYLEWKRTPANDPDADYLFDRLSEGLQKDLEGDTYDVSQEAVDKEQRDIDIEMMYLSSQEAFEEAEETMKQADAANINGDKFTFTTVLFAVVLFFGGLSTTTQHIRLKFMFISIASIFFVYTVLRFLTLEFV